MGESDFHTPVILGQVEEESMKVGFRRKDALCRSKRCVGIKKIAAGLR